MEKITEKTITVPDSVNLLAVVGQNDSNLRLIEEYFQVRLIARGNLIKVMGREDEIESALHVLEDLISAAKKKRVFTREDVLTSIRIARSMINRNISENSPIVNARNDLLPALETFSGIVKPKTEGQEAMLNAIKENDVLFAVGPAGTGKTYLAVAFSVAFLKENLVKKIVLARPAVEAGESLGYLPGDYKEKIDPYLKPLYDALEDMMPRDLLKRFLDQQIIEILPLAYMRGRTLNNAFVILDEAQNTTFMQMKMFLTRLGINSKCVITGDITQIDLPSKKDSGLVSSYRILAGISGISFVQLTEQDVVRHPLVKEIINAYEKYDKKRDHTS